MPCMRRLLVLTFLFIASNIVAQPEYQFGQYLQISTKLRNFDGRPSWLIIIRDVDHNQNIPYLYDFERGENAWLAFTYGRNYLIIASIMSFSPYQNDPYCTKKIYNFCNLESHGRIIRGQSIRIRLKGELTPNRNRFSCHVNYYDGSQFYFANSVSP